jgi:hypothetical protein
VLQLAHLDEHDDGERAGSIGYEAHLGQESGRVRLYCTTTRRDGERRESDHWIELATTPQPFGGRRWWFVCPRTGRRAAKLYLPHAAFIFAARQAYRLAYRCQREAAHDRALRRAFKLRGNLGADGGIGDHVPKPKWTRYRRGTSFTDLQGHDIHCIISEAELRCVGIQAARCRARMARSSHSRLSSEDQVAAIMRQIYRLRLRLQHRLETAFMLPTLRNERDHKRSRDGKSYPCKSIPKVGSDVPF